MTWERRFELVFSSQKFAPSATIRAHPVLDWYSKVNWGINAIEEDDQRDSSFGITLPRPDVRLLMGSLSGACLITLH